MNFLEIERVLLNNGFERKKGKGSHRKYVAIVNGERRVVSIPFHGKGKDIKPGVLSSIIRQSGLNKDLFK